MFRQNQKGDKSIRRVGNQNNADQKTFLPDLVLSDPSTPEISKKDAKIQTDSINNDNSSLKDQEKELTEIF